MNVEEDAPEPCAVCMKISDASRVIVVVPGTPVPLCGTHFDAWLRSPERRRAQRQLADFLDTARAEWRNGASR